MRTQLPLKICFKKDFKNLKYEFEKVGNPFFEDTEILYTLVTENGMDTSANKSIYEVLKRVAIFAGKYLYWGLFLIKLQALLEKDSNAGVFL